MHGETEHEPKVFQERPRWYEIEVRLPLPDDGDEREAMWESFMGARTQDEAGGISDVELLSDGSHDQVKVKAALNSTFREAEALVGAIADVARAYDVEIPHGHPPYRISPLEDGWSQTDS